MLDVLAVLDGDLRARSPLPPSPVARAPSRIGEDLARAFAMAAAISGSPLGTIIMLSDCAEATMGSAGMMASRAASARARRLVIDNPSVQR